MSSRRSPASSWSLRSFSASLALSLHPSSMVVSAFLTPSLLRVPSCCPKSLPFTRAPVLSPPSTDIRANQVSWCPWGDSALCTRPMYGALTLGLVWWSGSFLSAVYARARRRLPCFFDCRTLPARRGASKRSHLDDHGPLQDPRDRLASRVPRF